MQAVLVSPAPNAEATYPPGGDDQAQKRLELLERLRELLLRYEQSFAVLKKISAKRLKNGYMGSVAEIGAELSATLQSTVFLPYEKDATLRLVEAAIAIQKQKINNVRLKPVQRWPVQKPAQPPRRFQRHRPEGIAAYSNWAEQFAGLASIVPPGETRVVNRETRSRSPDGNTIEARYAKKGKWRILKQTVTETDAAIVKVVEARFSRYFSDGSIRESWEKETTICFKEFKAPVHNLPTAPLSSMAPRIEPRLDKWAWYDFLRQFVRVNPDTMRFTIGKREYQIDQFRFKEMAHRGRIVNCIGMRGQIAEPCISRIAEKVAYLHRSKQDVTFDSIIEDSLPLLIGNVDYFLEEDELRPSKAAPQFQRPRATTVVAHTTSQKRFST